MRRLVWVAFGATAGALAVHRLSRLARAAGPEGLARTASGLADAARETALTVRLAMAQREDELRLGLGLDAGLVEEPDEDGRHADGRHEDRPDGETRFRAR